MVKRNTEKRKYLVREENNGPAPKYLRDLVGIDEMLLGSGLPFPPGDPDPLSALRNDDFSDTDIHRIADSNLRSLFGF